MLDADASFRPDPDAPAPLRIDPVEAFAPASDPAPDSLPMESLPTLDLAVAHPALAEPSPDVATANTDATAVTPQDSASDPRPVTPRRPLRFSSARIAEDTPIHALPVLNLFDGVFEDEDDLTDPRLLRSRARARRLLAAHEAALSDAERNLWHDDPAPEPAPAPVVQDSMPEPHGRRVRHLTAADIAPPAPEPIHDPLRDRLHAARAALYTQHPDDPLPEPHQTLAARLILAPLKGVANALRLPIAEMADRAAPLRIRGLRLPSRLIAAAGTATALLMVAPFLPF